jgi:hypothetical protein
VAGAIVVGAVSGVVVHAGVRWRAGHVRVRDEREDELHRAQILYVEMTEALRSVDMAVRIADGRWVEALSASATLEAAWIAQGPKLERLDPAQWEIVDWAVKAVAPRQGLVPAGGWEDHLDELQRSLVERQARLRGGIEVLRETFPLS